MARRSDPKLAADLRWIRDLDLCCSAPRVGRFLERQGLLERDAESASLAELALADEPMEERSLTLH